MASSTLAFFSASFSLRPPLHLPHSSSKKENSLPTTISPRPRHLHVRMQSSSSLPSSPAVPKPSQSMESSTIPSDPNIETALQASLQTVPEQPTPITLELSGTLPLYIPKSKLFRLGPGTFDNVFHSDGVEWKIGHWFDGLSVIHEFSFLSNTTVTYRSKALAQQFTRTVSTTSSQTWNEITFGTDIQHAQSWLRKLRNMIRSRPIDPETGKPPQPNTSVLLTTVPGHGATVRSDVATNLALDMQSLEPKRYFEFREYSPDLGGTFSAAHAATDANTGEFFNFVHDFNSMDSNGTVVYNVFSIDQKGNARTMATFRDIPTYIHSVACTENYIVLVVCPLRVQPLSMLWQRKLTAGLKFEKDMDTTFYLIPRDKNNNNKVNNPSKNRSNNDNETNIRRVTSKGFFFFHVANCFETSSGDVVIDLCKFNNSDIINAFNLDVLRNTRKGSDIPNCSMTRFTLGRDANVAFERTINDRYIELPRVAPSVEGKEDYKFTYGVGHMHAVFDAVVKINMHTGERATWISNGVVGEPIFIPEKSENRQDETEEDRGCLLVVVVEKGKENEREGKWRSSLVVLDAKTLGEVARATVPVLVPLGFHGTFLYDQNLY